MPWGAVKDWKGIQIWEYSFVASSVILLKCVSGKLTSSKEIVLSGPIEGITEIGPQINMIHSDFVQFKKNATMNVYA
jgi:hypothetical protein